jgi:pimeloyl-ACP methyl ester carboxylesterase
VQSASGYQRINGIKLFIHRFRDPAVSPSGLTLLLVHGFMDAGATWDFVVPELTRAGHEVIAPDLRGFGQSDPVGPGGYYHFPDYVADLSELCDTLAARRLGIIGHSMGGTIAALLAGASPELCERLALLEGLGPVATKPEAAIDRLRVWLKDMREAPRVPRALTSLQEAVERLVLRHPRVPREVIESRARLLTRTDAQGRLIWAYDPLHRTTSPVPFNVEAFKVFLSRIDCPTLVVSGGPSGWHPEDEAARIALLRNGSVFELPNAGHMMHWTEPLPLATRLLSFFGEPPLRRAITITPIIADDIPPVSSRLV